MLKETSIIRNQEVGIIPRKLAKLRRERMREKIKIREEVGGI
jgi:hypothetical protein